MLSLNRWPSWNLGTNDTEAEGKKKKKRKRRTYKNLDKIRELSHVDWHTCAVVRMCSFYVFRNNNDRKVIVNIHVQLSWDRDAQVKCLGVEHFANIKRALLSVLDSNLISNKLHVIGRIFWIFKTTWTKRLWTSRCFEYEISPFTFRVLRHGIRLLHLYMDHLAVKINIFAFKGEASVFWTNIGSIMAKRPKCIFLTNVVSWGPQTWIHTFRFVTSTIYSMQLETYTLDSMYGKKG